MSEAAAFNRSPAKDRPRKKFSPLGSWIVPTLVAGAIAGFAFLEVGFPLIGCNVKGNVSIDTGERIYHVPGQTFYSKTKISWLHGERWFCSEEAAREAGWRKARR